MSAFHPKQTLAEIIFLQAAVYAPSWWMSDSRSPSPLRRGRWTAERQLAFLIALAETRSIAGAAASVGLSRESAYRLRSRPAGALFALLWDRTIQPETVACHEGYNSVLNDGQIVRLLGTSFRRKCGDFAAIGPGSAGSLSG